MMSGDMGRKKAKKGLSLADQRRDFVSKSQFIVAAFKPFKEQLESQQRQLTDLAYSDPSGCVSIRSLLRTNNEIQVLLLDYKIKMEQECLNLLGSKKIHSSAKTMTSKSSKVNSGGFESSLKKEPCDNNSHISVSSSESEEAKESGKTMSSTNGLIFPSPRKHKKWEQIYLAIEKKGMTAIQPKLAIPNFGEVKPRESSARIALNAALCILQPEANFENISKMIPSDFGRRHPVKFDDKPDDQPTKLEVLTFSELKITNLLFVRQPLVTDLVGLFRLNNKITQIPHWKYPQIIEFEHSCFKTENDTSVHVENYKHVGFATFDPPTHLFCRGFCRHHNKTDDTAPKLGVWQVGKAIMDQLDKGSEKQANKRISEYLGGKVFPFASKERGLINGQSRHNLRIRAVWSVVC